MNLKKSEKKVLQIERACGDLRRGMPVFIKSEDGTGVYVVSPDSSAQEKINNSKLVISQTRAAYLFPDKEITGPVSINVDALSPEEILALCSSVPPVNTKNISFYPARRLESAALKLAKISELLPAVIVFENEKTSPDYLSIGAKAIDSYMENVSYSLFEACRAPLTLQKADKAEIIAYRPKIGAPEHYAIVIGAPEKEPLVRVHSSCYTGDLLASLTCDCRDQLQSAIEIMGAGQGGIILYLMQEGRGIGLVNKLRAYDFKEKGMDTVQANRALGFDDDERLFLPAAEILKKLGITNIRLLTNNPLKATSLEEYGIKVVECVPHIMEVNQHNKDYMQTKADKMGHNLS